MKNVLLGLSLLLLLAACTLQSDEKTASGRQTSEKREVEHFSRIFFAGNGNLFLQQGDTEEITIETDESLLPYVKTEVKDGTLYIEEKPLGWLQSFKSRALNVYVSLRKLEEVTLAGKAKVTADKEIRGGALVVRVSGAGQVDLPINYEKLSASAAGSAQYTLKGQVTNQDIQITGSCLYDALNLASQQTSIDIRGNGQVNVNVQNELTIIITGNGLVRYVGKPSITQKVFGKGKIEELNQ